MLDPQLGAVRVMRVEVRVRGPRGGYRLARERRRISVAEIIRIVRELEGTPDPSTIEEGSEIGIKVVRPIWVEMQEEMMKRFETRSIEDLCRRARELKIDRDAPDVPDFSI